MRKGRRKGLFCQHTHIPVHIIPEWPSGCAVISVRLWAGAAWSAGVLHTGMYVRLLAGAAWDAGV
jgi:hypothetical protein